jgi:hypothetical protein
MNTKTDRPYIEKTTMINFDRTKVKALRKAYSEAVKEKREQFVFEEKDFLTAYAKYLLQYLGSVFKV